MKRPELSEWFYFKDPMFGGENNKGDFYSEVLCYRFLPKHPSLKAVATIYWIPQSRQYFGIIFDGEAFSDFVYRVECKTFESAMLKIDLKLIEMKYEINIFW